MKINSSCPLLAGALLFSTGLFSQATPSAKMTPVTMTASQSTSAAAMANLRIADTTTMKISKLQEETKKQQQDLTDLKAAVATLTSKYEKDHLELGLVKLQLKTIGDLQLPTAYAAFNPVKDPATNGYSWKLETQYGITGKPVQSYSTLTMTLSHSFESTPVVITSLGEDHINTNSTEAVGIVTYYFMPPNTLRITIKEAKGSSVIAPFSVIVYGR